MRIALIGQPNCGKSTLFNQVAGYKAETGNFSGTTVTFTESKVRVIGQVVNLVDLPGTYSLSGTNPAESESYNYLGSHAVDVIVNVIDASHMAQGLELTLELLDLGRPLVVALNMIDEARRVGLMINGPKLEQLLGVPVLPLVASRGQGVKPLFITAYKIGQAGKAPGRMTYSPELEATLNMLEHELLGADIGLPPEPVAIRLLEEDPALVSRVDKIKPGAISWLKDTQQSILEKRGQRAMWVISGERHGRAAQLAQEVVTQGPRRITLRDRLDDVLLHPVFGYFALLAILLAFFQFVYAFGRLLENPLLSLFDGWILFIQNWAGAGSFTSEMLSGLLQGVSGGVAIVLPYLAPFLFGLGLLEDIGYLPRVAFLMDSLMHRLGLHGKAIVPFILGYGCNVPAIMSTRILEEKRDRFLAAALATLVPCAARLSVVFGLVAFYLGPNLALVLYLFNLVVIALTARILTGLMPEDSPGLIMEMPVYRLPTLKSVANKAWFRVREFVVEAWPVLIVGSLVMALLNYFNWTNYFNVLFRPVSWALGLPSQVGVPLIFGVLRKELSLVMLRQAMGGVELGSVFSPVQMITYSVFVMFYIPCLATLTVLRKELGTRIMLYVTALTVVVAMLSALLARGVALLLR
jgi:ferrous iron transport protein B